MKLNLIDNKVCAIIVTFQPELLDLSELILSLNDQVEKIVIVENTPESTLCKWLNQQEYASQVHLIDLKENKGIAAAHNVGINWAKSTQCQFVLLMDQDSRAGENMVAQLTSTYDELQKQGERIAAIGPNYIDIRSNLSSGFIRFEGTRLIRLPSDVENSNTVYHAEYLITSGSLISIDVFDTVGLLDELLFIDYVDLEWCMRANSKGYKNFGVCAASLYHRLGDHLVTAFGRAISCHSPLRHYYYFRNAILLYKRRYLTKSWRFRDALRLPIKYVFYSLFTKPRMKQLTMMTKGIWHGLLGTTGRHQ